MTSIEFDGKFPGWFFTGLGVRKTAAIYEKIRVLGYIFCYKLTWWFFLARYPFHASYKNCRNHFLASSSSVKFFIGIGGLLNLKRNFIMIEASPGFETIAIAE